VIDIMPGAEDEAGAKARAEKQIWLQERGYRVVTVSQADLTRDLAGVLDSLAAAMTGPL
jgi:very-short-patch-repair endonuclease